jgi:hypothetical protein
MRSREGLGHTRAWVNNVKFTYSSGTFDGAENASGEGESKPEFDQAWVLFEHGSYQRRDSGGF